jgi:hypothetical protein
VICDLADRETSLAQTPSFVGYPQLAVFFRSSSTIGSLNQSDHQSPIANHKSQISAVPLQVEQAQLDTWIDIGRLIVEVGKAL